MHAASPLQPGGGDKGVDVQESSFRFSRILSCEFLRMCMHAASPWQPGEDDDDVDIQEERYEQQDDDEEGESSSRALNVQPAQQNGHTGASCGAADIQGKKLSLPAQRSHSLLRCPLSTLAL